MTTQNHPLLDAIDIISTMEVGADSYEVCASCVARFDDIEEKLNVALSAFVRRFEIRGKDQIFKPPWLPKAETVRMGVTQGEALDAAKEVFASWVKRIRASIPPASEWARHNEWLAPGKDSKSQD